jgi:hypothetical protein
MSADPNPPKPPVARLALNEHDALPAGTRFGEFEIIHVLGVGGFGIVYLAQDHSLERQVALKEYMPAALAARGAGAMVTVRAGAFAETYAAGLRSFINEARLLARFDHPSLVQVYRFWEDNGTAYMVMPYLQGRTLRDARRAMAQPPDEAWIRAVLAPVLDALELLHREGVFHRDIAPDNILLPPGAAPILLDFGAARRVISDRTQSLTAILKPSYAPIEQYAEMATMRQGPWTDLYALGAVLHYLLFGVPPAPATARAVQPDAEPIERRDVPGVAPRFVSTVAWMLGVRPLDRPQSVAALRAALDGELPIPSSGWHGVTVAGAAAAPIATGDAPTQVDRAHQPTAPMTAPPPPPWVAAPVAAARPPAPASGGAPMRSTPPGRAPPTYVPPARPTPIEALTDRPEPATAPVPPRRGRRAAGMLVAAAIAAGVLWQFVSVVGGTRKPAPPLTAAAASSATRSAPVSAASAAAVPSLAQVTSPPPAEAAASAPESVVPLPVKAVEASVEPAARAASGSHRARPNAAAPSRREAAVGAGPASARDACGDRGFFALALCIDRECERPRFRGTPECARLLEAKRRRAER